ncbi:hypothetical protein BGU32_18735 [Clostridioides difficile]|nr:hypothetical protein BGU32_18735 [Clostridioides difficile]
MSATREQDKGELLHAFGDMVKLASVRADLPVRNHRYTTGPPALQIVGVEHGQKPHAALNLAFLDPTHHRAVGHKGSGHVGDARILEHGMVVPTQREHGIESPGIFSRQSGSAVATGAPSTDAT